MFPLFVSLFGLDDVGEEPAIEFGQREFVADDCFNPVFFVLEGQVQYKPPASGELFLELVVDEVENVFFFNGFAGVEVFNHALLYRSEPSNHISIFIGFGRVFLKELDPFEHLADNAL